MTLASAANRLNRIKFKRHFNPVNLTALMDKVQIQQVLLNLVRNAAEAMEGQDNGEIVISAAIRNGMVEIGVADSGPGLAPEIAPRLFEPFISTKEKGMGVGLSICRAIVESHGGRLWATTNPKSGMTSSFTLAKGVAQDESSND